MHYLLQRARARAKRTGLRFELTDADIYVPERCPALGIPLVRAKGKGARDGSPSLDQFRLGRGYVPGNVHVISHRANSIKGTYTVEQLRSGIAIAKLYEDQMRHGDGLHEWELVLQWMEAVELLT